MKLAFAARSQWCTQTSVQDKHIYWPRY